LSLTFDVRKIPGWFSLTDQKMFSFFLQNQILEGDLFEIGVYLGKSSIFIESFRKDNEKLHVCDLFEDESTDLINLSEIQKSYDSLSLENFKRYFLKYHSGLPVIHNCNSMEVSMKLSGNTFRFIHVDGSHLYEYVKHDLEFAALHIERTEGIIVLDDFRASHTPGVAAAMWDILSKGELVVLALSDYKAYLVHHDSRYKFGEIRELLRGEGLQLELFRYFDRESFRVKSSHERDFPSRYPALKKLLPPVLFDIKTRLTLLRTPKPFTNFN